MSVFREAPSADGTKGPLSFRRIAAAFFAVSGVALAAYGVNDGIAWQGIAVLVGIPTAAVLVLTFFTTWSDIASIVNGFRGVQSSFEKKDNQKRSEYKPYDGAGE